MKQLRVTVDGKAYEVTVEVLGESGDTVPRSSPPPVSGASVAPPSIPSAPKTPRVAVDGAVVSPMSGSIVRVLVQNGDKVGAGQEVVVLEAMKMETAISAPHAGVVAALSVAAGTTVEEGQALFKVEG